jgi:hypothetical protein
VTEILAVAPQAGAVIHLHLPGYQPGAKRRSIGHCASLCGVLAVTRTTTTAPLAEALSWPDTHKDCGCPRAGWRWCRACLGHAATFAGVVDQVLDAIVKAGRS